jgi:hypothetical protein
MWQDLKLLVVDPKVQRLKLRVRDTIGFTTITVGSIEVSVCSTNHFLLCLHLCCVRNLSGVFPALKVCVVLCGFSLKSLVDELLGCVYM